MIQLFDIFDPRALIPGKAPANRGNILRAPDMAHTLHHTNIYLQRISPSKLKKKDDSGSDGREATIRIHTKPIALSRRHDCTISRTGRQFIGLGIGIIAHQ